MNFIVGESYTNEKGTYKVICEGFGKHKGKITVKFEDGTVTVLSKEEESKRAKANKEAAALPLSKKIAGRSEEHNYYTFLGMLTISAHIMAQVPENKRHVFAGRYYELTRKELAENQSGLTKAADNQWGITMRLNFSKSVAEYMPNLSFANIMLELKNGDMCQINCNDWIYELLQHGFDLGSSHNIEAIEVSVPIQHREAFRYGLEFGSLCAAENKAA